MECVERRPMMNDLKIFHMKEKRMKNSVVPHHDVVKSCYGIRLEVRTSENFLIEIC